MSALTAAATALWTRVLGGGVNNAVTVISALVTGVREASRGDAPNVLASIAQHSPAALALIEEAAEQAAIFVGGPLAGAGVEMAIQLLAMSHRMTPEEEQRWFDQQKGGG